MISSIMEQSPKSGSPAHIDLNTALEPLDCTTPPALNLCTRRREDSRSPNPEGANQGLNTISPDTNTPTDYHKSSDSLQKPLYFRNESDSESSLSSECVNEFSPYPFTPNLTTRTKTSRPFKAYPKDPFFLALGASTADAILGQESTEAYAEFRKKMLIQVQANNPPPGVTNTKMRRSNGHTNQDGKDQSYWERRRKNNEAAKRSRDARRAKEDEIAIRAAFLEQENLKLKYEIAALRNEVAKQRCLINY